MASKRSKLPILSNKEGRLKFSFRLRGSKGTKSKVKVVELTFQTPVSKKYTCILCHNLLRDPCQVTCCGSNYCRECINSLSTTSGKCASKDCGKNYAIITNGPVVEDMGRKIMQMKVYCFLKESGCKWVGTIEQLEMEHFVGGAYSKRDTLACQYQAVKCPNKCGAVIPRGNMVEHRLTDCAKELSVCEYCGMEDSSYEIYRVHQELCHFAPVECPNRCGMPGTVRCKILAHLENECPLRLVSCVYRHVGCEEQVRFLNLNEHITTSYQRHLELMSEKLEFVSNENEELRREKHSDVEMFVSKLKDLQAGICSIEEILEYYETISESTPSEAECLPVSAGSGHTLTGGESLGEEDSESGYNSVVNELTSRINGLTSDINLQNGLESTPEFINAEDKYMNVQQQQSSHSSKVLPDVCATTSHSKNSYENTESHHTAPYKGRYSVPTIKHPSGGKGAERSASFPAENLPEPFDGNHLARANCEPNLSSVLENVVDSDDESFPDHGQSRPSMSAQCVTPDFYAESSGSSSSESSAVEESSEEVEDPWQLRGKSVSSDATRGSAPRVTFKPQVDIMSQFFIGENDGDDSDGQGKDDEEVPKAPQLDSASPKMTTRRRKAKRAKKADRSLGAVSQSKWDNDDQLSCSSMYDLPFRLEFVSKSYNPKFSEAVRPRNPSTSSGTGTPPPLPPRTHTRSLESLLDEPPGASTFLTDGSKIPSKEAAATCDLIDRPFPLPRMAKIKPIPVEPPKIGSLTSNGITSTASSPQILQNPKTSPETTDPDDPLQTSQDSQNRALKPLPSTPSRARTTSETAVDSAGLLSTTSTGPSEISSQESRPLSPRKPLPPPRKRLTSVSSRRTHPSLQAGSSVSLPVHELDMGELKEALKRRSVFFK